MPARLTAAILLTLFVLSPVGGQDFRVETDVFVEGEEKPVVQTLTIFSRDVVYDFLLSGDSGVTIFDTRRGRLVLLDVKRQVKTTFTTEELLEFTAAIKATAAAPRKQKFDTEFVEQFNPSENRLTVQGSRLQYDAVGVPPKHDSAIGRYREFADWYARLNAVQPGNLPPFGRLQLNHRLAEEGLLPEKITRRYKDRETWSKHAFVWLLSTTDRKRIENAGAHLANFRSLSLAEYWRVEQVAENRN